MSEINHESAILGNDDNYKNQIEAKTETNI